MSSNAALIVGVTGIVGIPLAEQLIQKKWKVYGISRRHADFLPSELNHIALDVTKEEDCKEKLKSLTMLLMSSSWSGLTVQQRKKDVKSTRNR